MEAPIPTAHGETNRRHLAIKALLLLLALLLPGGSLLLLGLATWKGLKARARPAAGTPAQLAA